MAKLMEICGLSIEVNQDKQKSKAYKLILQQQQLFKEMQSVLSALQEQKNWKQFVQKYCRKNKINVQIANYFTPKKIRILYERFTKLYESKIQKDSTCWYQNELKAFHWFLAVLSRLRERLIQNFSEEQWKIMSQIFLNKDNSVMQYQAIKLVNQRVNKNRQWSQEQTELLSEIIKQHQNSNKWNQIARKLFQRSTHKFFRSGKQCRQRWLNHLDPNKKRGEWNDEEDKLIIHYILFNGKRWSNIAKELGNHRTQHMVKNRYKTLIIKQKKITSKISNQNSLLREIGKRLLGEEALPPKRQKFVKKQSKVSQVFLSNISEVSEQEQVKDMQELPEKQNCLVKRIPIFSPKSIRHPIHEQLKRQVNKRITSQQGEEKNVLRDPVLSQIVQDYSKGMGKVSTPLSNYEIQQIYSPFYINYQGITPYLSTSPSLPFFTNSSFSAFDSFNQNLFIWPSSGAPTNDKKDENQ